MLKSSESDFWRIPTEKLDDFGIPTSIYIVLQTVSYYKLHFRSKYHTVATNELLCLKKGAPTSKFFSHFMNNWHPWQMKKSKSLGPFGSYQLNSIANLAHLAHFLGKWARLAVLLSWQLKNGPQDFDFFICHGCQLFILCEIHCYLYPRILWV